jgi:hypothetical protein
MTIEQFEELSLTIGLSSLVLFMLFIVWRLAKESNAGKFGTFILFLVLGLGIFGFVMKKFIAFLLGVE